MNIKKLPTMEDYQKNRNWTVAIVGLDGYFDNEEGRYDFKTRMNAIRGLRDSDCFGDLYLRDIKRIIDDVSKLHPALDMEFAEEIMHPSQHLAVNLPFSKALDIQEALSTRYVKTVIFPTSVY